MAVVRRRVLVSGRVQGVFFRDGARRQALACGLAGSARNLPDGRVEVVLEGPADRVDAALVWLRHGPPDAHVEAVDVTTEAPTGAAGFRIR